MKKLLAFAAMAAAAAGVAHAQMDVEDISVTTAVAFESKYVFRGVQYADESFQPAVSMAIAGATFGMWSNLPLDEEGTDTEVDLYARYKFSIADAVAMEVGATYYWYDDADATFEPLIGFSFDVAAAPAIYFYYDTELEVLTVEVSAGHEFDLSDSIAGSSVKVYGYIGGAWVDEGDDYYYAGAAVDFIYALTDNVKFAIGGRYARNDLDDTVVESDSFWFGANVTAGF